MNVSVSVYVIRERERLCVCVCVCVLMTKLCIMWLLLPHTTLRYVTTHHRCHARGRYHERRLPEAPTPLAVARLENH
jgi:hypothetical protein